MVVHGGGAWGGVGGVGDGEGGEIGRADTGLNKILKKVYS